MTPAALALAFMAAAVHAGMPGAQTDLSISKVVTSTPPFFPGGMVELAITVANAASGPVTDVIGATVTDTLPAGLTCTWSCAPTLPGVGTCSASGSGDINDTVDLPVGASVEYSLTCTANVLVGTLSNTASVSPPPGIVDLDPSNDSSTAEIAITAAADLSITKDDGVT
ncbi:MAG: DUF11 domain-containing protein, partial [Holophagales bacterium]|nr:DUF11 domain-containing protein [Holophagales bacterium]